MAERNEPIYILKVKVERWLNLGKFSILVQKPKQPQLKLSARTKNRIFKPQWGKMIMVREDGISL